MRPTLLIAETDVELCRNYRKLFGESGYLVEIATDGLQCLAKLRQYAPDLLILDRQLRWGGADGVLAWLREELYGPSLPVILTTTRWQEDIEWPVVNCMRKPFALTEFLNVVDAAGGCAKSVSSDSAVLASEVLPG